MDNGNPTSDPSEKMYQAMKTIFLFGLGSQPKTKAALESRLRHIHDIARNACVEAETYRKAKSQEPAHV